MDHTDMVVMDTRVMAYIMVDMVMGMVAMVNMVVIMVEVTMGTVAMVTMAATNTVVTMVAIMAGGTKGIMGTIN